MKHKENALREMNEEVDSLKYDLQKSEEFGIKISSAY